MAPLWFLGGVVFTLSIIVLVLPWLRTVPRLASLPALPWQAGGIAVLTLASIAGLWLWFRSPEPVAQTRASVARDRSESPAVVTDSAVDSWAGIANALSRGTGANTDKTAAQSGAQPMEGAIASLEARLSKGGGSADDWELLAKSYEFLGRPAEAAKARAHELPPLPAQSVGSSDPVASRSSGAGTVLSGEVSLAAGLKAKAASGATLFIVAKSVDSPGPPVAVYRTAVDRWPVKFELSDSQSMLPGRNLSSTKRVTVEARISQTGQPMPAPGDLQGASGTVDPAGHRPLDILIDKVVQ